MTTYAEIRAKKKATERESIRQLLMKCAGQEKRITKQEICQKIFGEYTTTKDRLLRDYIAELVKDGHPIVTDTGEGGFWWCGKEQELVDNIADLSTRIAELIERREGLYKAHRSYFNRSVKDAKNQSSLFDAETMQKTKGGRKGKFF